MIPLRITLYQVYLQAAGCRRCLCFFTEVYFVFCVLARSPWLLCFLCFFSLLCLKVLILPVPLVLMLVVCVTHTAWCTPTSLHTLSLSPSPLPSFLLHFHSYLLSDPICFHFGVPSSISFRLGSFNSVAHAFIDSNSSSSGSPVPLHRT